MSARVAIDLRAARLEGEAHGRIVLEAESALMTQPQPLVFVRFHERRPHWRLRAPVRRPSLIRDGYDEAERRADGFWDAIETAQPTSHELIGRFGDVDA